MGDPSFSFSVMYKIYPAIQLRQLRLLTHFQDMSVFNLSQKYSDLGFQRFPSVSPYKWQDNTIKPQPLPCTCFPSCHSLIIPPFKVIHYMELKVSLNNPKNNQIIIICLKFVFKFHININSNTKYEYEYNMFRIYIAPSFASVCKIDSHV